MRSLMSVRYLAALVAVSVAVLVGCGSSGTEEPAARTTTTGAPAATTSEAGSGTDEMARADFVTRANEICREAIEALSGQEPDTADEDAMVAYLTDTFIPSVRQQLDDIRGLGFPPGDEAELAEMLDGADAALDRLEADPATVLTSGEDPFAEVNDQLNAYGLTECGGD